MEVLLKKNNLYANAIVIEDLVEQNSVMIREPLELRKDSKIEYHTVTEFDRIDLIAYKYYKDIVTDASKYWWLIADINSIDNPLDLTSLVGVKIIIPNLTDNLLNR